MAESDDRANRASRADRADRVDRVDRTIAAHDPVAVELDGVTVAYDRATPVVRDVDLALPPGGITVLLGPSGCGKTTLLRSIAGLERPTAGTVRLGERVVSSPTTWVPPERRQVGMVFQDAALFPHLTVAENVGFGLRTTTHERRRRVGEMLDLVGLADHADRRPGTLSGGQRQRVALARSLAPSPAVLLLDEPFSALDATLRAQLRVDVARIVREVGVTTVFVTHDQIEAFVVGDRIGVMHDGVLRQVGTAEQLYRTPSDPWIARFVGEAHVVAGEADAGVVAFELGRIPLVDPTQRGAVEVLVRPEDLELSEHATPGVAGLPARVVAVDYLGAEAIATVVTPTGGHWRVRVASSAVPVRGAEVTVRHRGAPVAAWPVA